MRAVCVQCNLIAFRLSLPASRGSGPEAAVFDYISHLLPAARIDHKDAFAHLPPQRPRTEWGEAWTDVGAAWGRSRTAWTDACLRLSCRRRQEAGTQHCGFTHPRTSYLVQHSCVVWASAASECHCIARARPHVHGAQAHISIQLNHQKHQDMLTAASFHHLYVLYSRTLPQEHIPQNCCVSTLSI